MPGDIAALRGIRLSLDAGGFLVLVVVSVLLWLLVIRGLRAREGWFPQALASGIAVLAVWVSLAGIAELTLFGTQGLGADPRLELDPVAGARGWAGIAWRPVVDNVTLFVPLGAALAAFWYRRGPLVPLAVAIAVSVTVETFQWAVPSGRIANSADVLANTVGALIGVLLAVLAGVSGRRARLRPADRTRER
jgi:hypothetical protein